MKNKIETFLREIIKKVYGIDSDVSLTIPPAKDFGDFSTNVAFSLAKTLGKSPKDIASDLLTGSQEEWESNAIQKIEVAGAFLNIFLDKYTFVKNISQQIESLGNEFLKLHLGDGVEISIEHTAANPNKHLHIGHLRNFSIADTLVRIMKNAGYNVTVQWFNDDQGLQVAKVLWGLDNLNLIRVEEHDEKEKYDTYCSKVYVASEKYLTVHIELADNIKGIIQKMEEGNNDISSKAQILTRKIVLAQLLTVQKFGVYYDLMISESTMTQSGEVERIIEELLKTGKVVKETEGTNAGCIVIKGLTDSKGNSLDDKVLIRSNDTAVYTGKDIVLHLWKFGLLDVNFQFEPFSEQGSDHQLFITTPHKNETSSLKPQHAAFHINVVDQRQSYPLEVVKQSLHALGFTEPAENLHHLAYETVSLSIETAKLLGVEIDEDVKVVAMSGRKGIEISIDEILGKMSQHIIQKSKEKSEESISDVEASLIAASALRYYMIKYGYNTIIAFDIDDALRADGDSGVYLMYAYVRARNIQRKAQEAFGKSRRVDSVVEPEAAIVDLYTTIAMAEEMLMDVAKNYQVSDLTSYAYNLAKKFSDFYQQINVINERDEEKRNFYITVVENFILVYSSLLNILGIYIPDRM